MRAKKKNCGNPRMSRASMRSWGPSAWTFLHTSSYAYSIEPTQEDRMNMYMFLYYFARVLPCKRCSDDFKLYLDKKLAERTASSILDSRKNMVRFVIDAHNAVNIKLGKRTYSYEEVDELYTTGKTSYMLIILSLIICICILCIMCKNKKKQSINVWPLP